MSEPTHESIPTGEWTASMFLDCHWNLAADIQDVFLNLDPRAITATVLDHRQVDFPRVVEALDDWFGEIADPYADEDGEAA
jgi:hypothetical protein